jgi:flavodoxin
MKAIIIYESLTGNTRKAAELMAPALGARGIDVLAVCPVSDVDLQALSLADVVVVGSWVDGIFVIGQRPARHAKLQALPAMAGKKAVVFCTFALNPGKVLDKMTRTIESLGATVLGGLAIRRTQVEAGVEQFADRVASALSLT